MKRIIKSIIALLTVGLFSFGVYYWFVINSDGTDQIKYIEPEIAFKSFSDIIKHPYLNGKVVYVDFWHTGCRPCLEAFQYLPELKEKFKGYDNLAFLYLGKDRSVPGEKFRWKQMIEKKNLTGTHYFMTNEKYDAIWSETVNDTTIMKAFPHYLIVDNVGHVINNNAPRPGGESLINVLTNTLIK